MPRLVLALVVTLLLAALPALAAERGAPPSLPERIAFGVFLIGTVGFLAWVAWLAARR